MKHRFTGALALALALSQLAAMPAMAEQSTAFRTAAPQSFSTDDLQRYGLSADDASKVAAYQQQGYRVLTLTPEQAQNYRAGAWSDNTLWWVVIGAAVVIVIVAAAD